MKNRITYKTTDFYVEKKNNKRAASDIRHKESEVLIPALLAGEKVSRNARTVNALIKTLFLVCISDMNTSVDNE